MTLNEKLEDLKVEAGRLTDDLIEVHETPADVIFLLSVALARTILRSVRGPDIEEYVQNVVRNSMRIAELEEEIKFQEVQH